MELELHGRIAWISGAGGALGAAIAERLAQEGARVYLSGRSIAALEATRNRIAQIPDASAAVISMDVGSRGEVDRAAAVILEAAGRIDILVNSTALPIFGAFLDLDDSDWAEVLQAKCLGYVRTMRAAIPSMVNHRFGRIVNLSGRGGRQPTPAHLPGAAANAAVNVISKGLADIHGKDNIRINVVSPGPIDTPRFSSASANTGALAERGQVGARPIGSTPLGRLGTTGEVADAVAFLVSERAAYTTGVNFHVDGGGTAAI